MSLTLETLMDAKRKLDEINQRSPRFIFIRPDIKSKLLADLPPPSVIGHFGGNWEQVMGFNTVVKIQKAPCWVIENEWIAKAYRNDDISEALLEWIMDSAKTLNDPI